MTRLALLLSGAALGFAAQFGGRCAREFWNLYTKDGDE